MHPLNRYVVFEVTGDPESMVLYEATLKEALALADEQNSISGTMIWRVAKVEDRRPDRFRRWLAKVEDWAALRIHELRG